MATLMQKLQLKRGQRLALLNASAEYQAQFDIELAEVEIVGSADDTINALVLFAKQGNDLQQFIAVEKTLQSSTMIWIAYPKKSSNIETDLNRDHGWAAISNRWEGVRLISLDGNWSILRFAPKQSEDDLIAQQYAKNKAMQPIYEKLEAAMHGWSNISQKVRKRYIAFVHNKQFMRVHPSTKSRIDVSLALKGKPFGDRLVGSGRIGDSSFTHKVVLKSAEGVDDQLLQWIRDRAVQF